MLVTCISAIAYTLLPCILLICFLYCQLFVTSFMYLKCCYTLHRLRACVNLRAVAFFGLLTVFEFGAFSVGESSTPQVSSNTVVDR